MTKRQNFPNQVKWGELVEQTYHRLRARGHRVSQKNTQRALRAFVEIVSENLAEERPCRFYLLGVLYWKRISPGKATKAQTWLALKKGQINPPVHNISVRFCATSILREKIKGRKESRKI